MLAAAYVPRTDSRVVLGTPEVSLWIAVLAESMTQAQRLGSRIAGGRMTPKAARHHLAREQADMADWLDGEHEGSLAWICSILEAALGQRVDVGPMREAYLLALKPRRRKRREYHLRHWRRAKGARAVIVPIAGA